MVAIQDTRQAMAGKALDEGTEAASGSHDEKSVGRPQSRYPTLAMAAGVVLLALAASSYVRLSRPSFEGAVPGPGDVQAQTGIYAPGQSSDWHTHTGLHAVIVISGTLTILDGECQRRTLGPGGAYVGGREVHLAINQTAAPVEIAVTYLFPVGVPHTEFHRSVPPPAGCEVG